MSNANVVYSQMWLKGLRGRIVEVADKLVAQVETSNQRWARASTRQAASLFRNALAVSRLHPGAKVVAWAGSRIVLGNFVGRLGDEYEVHVGGRGQNTFTAHVLPLAVAQSEGVWPFRPGMQVAAYVDEVWVRAAWIRFEEGDHVVRLGDGSEVLSDRAHTAADALSMSLIAD